MKEFFTNLFKNVFGACMTFAVLMGAVVAVIYLLGFVVGGGTGEQMALFGSKIMKYCITISALGSVIGMLAFYIEGTHELQMENRNQGK